mgnify:CR=1 FL=1
MQKVLSAVLAVAALSLAGAHGESLTKFFGSSNFEPLAKTKTVLNLVAQSEAKKGLANVNQADDFFLINGDGKLVVNFDKMLKNKGEVSIPEWIGVARYDNHAIKADLQAGYEAVKAHYKVNELLGHVVVYKTLNTGRLVYDYALETGEAGTACQEYLYVPATKSFQIGMKVNCFFSLEPFKGKTAIEGAAGKTK